MSSSTRTPARRTPALRRAHGFGSLRLRIVLMCAIGVLACLVVPNAAAQVTSTASRAAVWTMQGSSTTTGTGDMIVVTPSIGAQTIAQQLKSRPAGARALLLTSFANDITTRETIRYAAGKNLPAPWTAKGVTTVRGRINTLMMNLHRRSAPIDLVVVRCDASLRANVFDAYGAAGWRAIERDRRFTPVKAAIGSTNLIADMATVPAVRAAWNDYFDRELDTALHMAIVPTIRRYYPNARIIAEGRYSLPASNGASETRAGGGFGSNDQPRFYMQGADMSPFDALSVLLADTRAVAAATGRPAIPSIPTRSWNGANGGEPVFRNSEYWNELVYHLMMSGSPAILMDRGLPTSGEVTLLNSLISEVRTQAGGVNITPHASNAVVDAETIVASAVLAGSTVRWRLTTAPGIETVRITFADNTTADVAIDPADTGAWYEHPSSQTVAFIQQAVAPPPGPLHPVLFDVVPSDAFEHTVEHAAQYLIVYQNAGDPDAGTTGIVNPAPVIAEINRQLALGIETEWGVLDFEHPFDDIIEAGPGDPRYAATMQSLVDTIRAVKAAFPEIKWTYYGFPRVGYYPNGRDWGQWNEVQREVYYAEYTAKFAALMPEMDWFMPSVYDKYERAENLPDAYSPPLVAEQEWRKAHVTAIRRYFELLDEPVPPILPVVSPWFQDAGVLAYLKPIPLDEFCEEQLQPVFEAGADGVSIWSSMDYFIRLATYQPLPPGYEAQTELVRTRFALDYFPGQAAQDIDWYSPEVLTALNSALDDIFSDAIEAAAVGGVLDP